jgi:hypothetical protein
MDKYSYVIEPIEWQLRAGKPASEITGYIGSGVQKHTFSVEGPEGPVAVKYLHAGYGSGADGAQPIRESNPAWDFGTMASEITPLIVGNDMEGDAHEKLLAADVGKSALVTTIGEGPNIVAATPAEIRAITDEQLVGLSTTLARMAKHGLHPHNGYGVLLGKKRGFNFVDQTLLRQEAYITKDGVVSFTSERGESLDPSQGVKSFLEYALDDLAAIREAERLPDGIDPREAKYVGPGRIHRDRERMKSRTEVLSRLGNLGVQ